MAHLRIAGFGAKIVQEQVFEDTGGARPTDSGVTLVQRQMPVFTQQGPAYDVLVAADENRCSHRTCLTEPVIRGQPLDPPAGYRKAGMPRKTSGARYSCKTAFSSLIPGA